VISTQRTSEKFNMAEKITKIPIPVANITKDSHGHFYTNFRPAEKGSRLILDRGPRTLKWLTERVISNAINAVAITNFDDWNYEFWTSDEQLKNLPKGWKYYQDSRLTVVAPPIDVSPAYFFKSQEVWTQQGHILIPGGERGVNFPSHLTLDATLDLVDKDSHLRKVADHLNSIYGLKESIKGRENRFDSYEFNAQADERGNNLTIQQAKRDGKPLEASSDNHHYSQIGKSNIVIKTNFLNFESGGELVKSINRAIQQYQFVAHMEYSPRILSLEHLAKNVMYNNVLKKLNPSRVDPDFAKPK
jgi:hypothetical protein